VEYLKCILVGSRALQKLRMACFGRVFDAHQVFATTESIEHKMSFLIYNALKMEELLPEESDLAQQPISHLKPPFSPLKYMYHYDSGSEVYLNADWYPSVAILSKLPKSPVVRFVTRTRGDFIVPNILFSGFHPSRVLVSSFLLRSTYRLARHFYSMF
jgi:hypothetical protein